MTRQLFIVCTLIVFAFVSVASGCSSASNPALVPHSGAVGIQRTPLSLGSWTTKAPMPTARYGLAVGVVSGRLYAVGGFNDNNQFLNAVEAYDPTTDTWVTKASMPTARAELAASVLGRRLYAIGGYNFGPENAVEAYDTATNTWAIKASMPTSRESLATRVAGRRIYAVGGANGVVLNTVEAFTR